MSQEPKATNPDNVGGLPELPEPIVLSIHGLQSAGRAIKGYTADQMRAYGELCRAAPAGGDAQPDRMKVICPACCHQFRAIPEQVQTLLLLLGVSAPFDAAPAGSGEVDGLARWWQAVEDDMMRDGLSHPDHHVVVRYVGKHERADLTAGDIRAALLRKLQQGADGDE